MQETPNNHSPIAESHLYQKDFKYLHDNPYHQKLAQFDQFILRDHESEDFQGKWNKAVFQNQLPISCEIGSGYGHFMLEYCQQHPRENFVGIEHRFKRTYNLARKLDRLPEKNFRYLRARGERLEFIFGENELDNIFYFFPDPWPKAKHHKKRLFQRPFLEAAHKSLKPGGVLYVKTDHHAYFQWMLDELAACEYFDITFKSWDLRNDAPEHFLSRYVTKFEKIFLKQEVKIKALTLINK